MGNGETKSVGAKGPTPITPPPKEAPAPKTTEKKAVKTGLAGTGKDAFEPAPKGADPAKEYPKIKDALTLSLDNLSRGPDDMQKVHDSLKNQSNPDYRSTVAKMEKDGLLETYLDKSSAPERERFLDQASRKGLVTKVEGRKRDGPLDPPDVPAMYKNDPKLPKSMRRAIHDHNIAAAKTYREEHNDYVQRYAKAVSNADSAAEIRLLGRPRDPWTLHNTQPGVDTTHPEYDKFRRDWGDAQYGVDIKTPYTAISDRMNELAGIRKPGSFWIEGEVGVSKKDGPLKTGVTVGGETGGGVTRAGVKTEQEVEVGPVTVGGEVGTGGKGGSVQVDAKIVKAKLSDDGSIELSREVVPGVSAKAKANAREATFVQGVEVEKEVGGYGAKASAGVGFQGLSPERAKEIVRSPGFFYRPPELDKGTAWKDLPEKKQLEYAKEGFTPKIWSDMQSS